MIKKFHMDMGIIHLYISTHAYTHIDINNKKLIIYLKYSKNNREETNIHTEMHKYIDNTQ